LFQAPLPLEESVFFHVVMRRHATREIVQVNFKTRPAVARTWAVFGNHWPSRSGGQFESEGYRAIAGETVGYFHQRVLEVHGPQTPVLAMGDFNDEPFDPSLVRHALSTRQPSTAPPCGTQPDAAVWTNPSRSYARSPTAATTSWPKPRALPLGLGTPGRPLPSANELIGAAMLILAGGGRGFRRAPHTRRLPSWHLSTVEGAASLAAI
jgi:hypothetical protein